MHDVFVEDFESEPFMTAFKTYFGEISGRERNWPMLFRQMNAEREVTRAVLLQDGGTAVGFVLFCPLQLSCPFFTETYGYIRELWVASEYRRRGNGRLLLALAEQDLANRETAQGTKIARVLLKADPRATGFFEKQGYTVSDTAVSEEGVMYTKHISR